MTNTPEAVRLADFAMRMQTRLGSCRESCNDYDKMAWDDYDAMAALLRRIPELESWKARVIKAAEEAHGPGAFRFKMSLNSRGTASNVFPQWLDQRWVSFVYAEDDAHIGLHARIAQLEAGRDQLRAELEKVRGEKPTAWILYAAKKPSLRRLSFDGVLTVEEKNSGWLRQPLITPPNADQKGQ